MINKLKKLMEDVCAMCPSTAVMMGDQPINAVGHVSLSKSDKDDDEEKREKEVSEESNEVDPNGTPRYFNEKDIEEYNKGLPKTKEEMEAFLDAHDIKNMGINKHTGKGPEQDVTEEDLKKYLDESMEVSERLLRRASIDKEANTLGDQEARLFMSLGMTKDDLEFNLNRRNISKADLYSMLGKMAELGIDYEAILNDVDR